ncbi:hypothetical protein [Halorubellus sp. JP-L1]|uniref:hypothetical protein n=1 Tax=Halorubellus sp. JP-L1 TaxID=2715753 RepID=UPI001877E5D7|nr:hypothetical protein [Halorubellus sp. JP-L1]
MPYELDSTPDEPASDESTGEPTTDHSTADASDSTTDASNSTTEEDATDGSEASDARSAGETLEDAVGVAIPDEHVGAFVAEAFEDAERDTTWADVVDAFVPPSAREAWNDLSTRDQATAVLDRAAGYDDDAIAAFESIPRSFGGDLDPEALDEALRCRRNADQFRDGVADAYGDGVLDDDALVGAVEDSAFDNELVARRERLLEEVDEYYDVDFRPYGGQLFDAEEGPDPDVDHDANATW